MDASELDYVLPAEAIAQVPVEPRDAARLLVDRGAGRAPSHATVADLPDLLDAGDVLVVNDTRVIPARLQLRKPTGGAVEVLLLERRPEGHWEALVRPGRRVAPGTVLSPLAPGAGDVTVEVGEVLGDDGRRRVTVHGGADDDLAVLGAIGEVPLPPYIHEPLSDADRYQTVFAQHPGSVAAPTAGLHLTDAVLDRCRTRGVVVVAVELAVGLGTFRPIATERVEDHPMHGERYHVPPAAREALAAPAGRVVAVGTTVVRALETWAETAAAEGESHLFIHGDRPFAVVDRLLTNFHVPRSSLLALVQAFVGPRWRDLYATALAEGYRFLSFGDAMLLSHQPAGTTA
ncbi:MAG: S-adenosylmethionine:tRNA ribosyltransferase-isomerase [Acidimicrobiales bacterium]|nr:S-adenosylmethionine:tRNA ribosyltransferase-isomerase [Acidimicrobiales bacterium]